MDKDHTTRNLIISIAIYLLMTVLTVPNAALCNPVASGGWYLCASN